MVKKPRLTHSAMPSANENPTNMLDALNIESKSFKRTRVREKVEAGFVINVIKAPMSIEPTEDLNMKVIAATANINQDLLAPGKMWGDLDDVLDGLQADSFWTLGPESEYSQDDIERSMQPDYWTDVVDCEVDSDDS